MGRTEGESQNNHANLTIWLKMFLNRPLVYITSALGFVVALVWLRRKKSIHCDTGGKPGVISQPNDTIADKIKLNGHATMPIDCIHDNRLPNETKLGKSAPIDINPSRISPAQMTDKQIDAEILKIRMQDTELKKLNSIEEQDAESLSSGDLPDSFEHKRMSFTFNRSICDEEPIIVKASMVPPKQFIIETEDTVENESQTIEDTISDDEKNKLSNYTTTNLSTPNINPPVSSPPLSLCSIQSNDSGKGSSIQRSVGTPAVPTIYEILLPQSLTGLLLGQRGSYVKSVKQKTGATILIKRHPESRSIKICAIEGTQESIDAALAMIRKKFPEKKYPNFTMERVYFATNIDYTMPSLALDPTIMQLRLIEYINNDVTISKALSNGEIFLNHVLHPLYSSSKTLLRYMNQSYHLCDAPMLPKIAKNDVCVGFIEDCWNRLQIMQHDADTDECEVRCLDAGGYARCRGSDLRQIRSDYLTVPFQAVVCYLSNLKPIGPDWSVEAIELLSSFKGYVLQAQIAGYAECGTPEVYLYASISRNNIVFINRELAARNLATWIENAALTA
ncbi:A-kinase anchor protein 1, mitochondrial [Pseudolycoriella hygida]|uniref:A-kinase anchor protein 1, mitochondrial n=1 Tax=Pseudolycoriella hygida TaxID=35572 RepID=A0A9Q0RZ12_9DIPT|nr:A-kinase anchor protein 1, mitochondrial [Pseudolycoriella hygida]